MKLTDLLAILAISVCLWITVVEGIFVFSDYSRDDGFSYLSGCMIGDDVAQRGCR
jgi:hypothetical protein